MDRLKIIRSKYLADYCKQQPMDLEKHFNRMKRRIVTPEMFRFYLVASGCNSSMIEGSNLDTETYVKLKDAGLVSKDVLEVDDIVRAYEFATANALTEENLLEAHRIITAHLPIPDDYRGAYRKQMVRVYSGMNVVYTGAETAIVGREMHKLFHDIALLTERDLSIDEVFYYAAMIHLVFVSIHPFADGNGRSARLVEKWFLSMKLGRQAWSVPSEKLYYRRKRSYYDRLHFRTDYKTIDYSRAIPFLQLLPMALNIK